MRPSFIDCLSQVPACRTSPRRNYEIVTVSSQHESSESTVNPLPFSWGTQGGREACLATFTSVSSEQSCPRCVAHLAVTLVPRVSLTVIEAQFSSEQVRTARVQRCKLRVCRAGTLTIGNSRTTCRKHGDGWHLLGERCCGGWCRISMLLGV